MRNWMRTTPYFRGLSMQKTAPVYLTAVIEYITAELLELAGNVAKDKKKKQLTNRHFMLAIKGDSEMDKFIGNVHWPNAGVVPFIDPRLLKGKAAAKAKAAPALGTAMDSLVDELVDRSGQASFAHNADLDTTTLG